MEHPWDRRLGVWYIAEDQPDLLAIVDSPQGSRTYGQLAGEAHQIVHTFRAMGVPEGAPVGVMMPNGLDLITIGLACQEGGWWFIPLNTHLTPLEINEIAEHSGAALLVIHEQFEEMLGDPEALFVSRVRTLTIGPTEVPGVDSLEALRVGQPSTPPDNLISGALFAYSSGTTGKPKGIRRRTSGGDPWQESSDGSVFGRAFDFRPFEGPHLVSTGMFHGGSYAYYMGALHVGHPLVIMARFDPEEALRVIEQHRITTAYMVPTQFVFPATCAPATTFRRCTQSCIRRPPAHAM
jgi:long-chain acyl-CoA synthetase